MVLYGIWLIDGNSGLLLSHITVPGFSFNPDLFSGFIAATHDFAHETSGGSLNTIALGNFKLLVSRGRVLMKVLAVGAMDPDTRYTQFFDDIEAKVDPIISDLHHDPDGFKVVTIELRKKLLDIISSELERFSTRKAPSDLSDIVILEEEIAQKLLKVMLQRPQSEFAPELATTKVGYSYPLASSITGLPDEDALLLLESLADYGLLLAEPIDTSLCCPKCESLHLHPHILCPSCQTPAHPIELYEHIPCGYLSARYTEAKEIQCPQCGAENGDSHEFRIFRGYQCAHCNSSFKEPKMEFVCHFCHTKTEPDRAGVKILKTYVLNPALISELEFFLSKHKLTLFQVKDSKPDNATTTTETTRPITPLEPKIRTIEPEITTGSDAKAQPSIPPTNSPSSQQVTTIAPEHALGDITQIQTELENLESALNDGTITEAEYDRKFVRLRLQLRRLRSTSNL